MTRGWDRDEHSVGHPHARCFSMVPTILGYGHSRGIQKRAMRADPVATYIPMVVEDMCKGRNRGRRE